MRIDFDLSRPIYQQIIDEIKRALARGEMAPGDKLPSHRDMAQQSKVNPNTVQHAYREMELEGLVETLRGQGTFIRRDPDLVPRVQDEMASSAVSRFLLEMESLGYSAQDIATCVLRTLDRRNLPPGSSQSESPGPPGLPESPDSPGPGAHPDPHQGAATGAKTDEVI